MADFPNIRRGTRWEDTKAREWQNLMDAAHGIASITVQPPLQQYRTGRHVNIRLGPIATQPARGFAAASVSARIFIFNEPLSREDDYLICREQNPEPDALPVYVAKPWLLRRTPFDEGMGAGQTHAGVHYRHVFSGLPYGTLTTNRIAYRLDQPGEELQVINPPWIMGDPITAIQVAGGTGIQARAGGDPVDVTWLALDEVRMWAWAYEDQPQ